MSSHSVKNTFEIVIEKSFELEKWIGSKNVGPDPPLVNFSSQSVLQILCNSTEKQTNTSKNLHGGSNYQHVQVKMQFAK